MVEGKRGNKARPNKSDLSQMKNVLRTMWLYQGFSIRKMSAAFNANPEYVAKYGTVSVSSCTGYIKEFRRDAEEWYDEDAVEKYAAEFVRKQHTMDEQIDRLDDVQKLIDVGEPKERELFLKFEMAKHVIHQDQIKMMSEIELVLHIKKINKERRTRNESLTLLPSEDGQIQRDDIVAAKRGYLNSTNVEEDSMSEEEQ